MMMDGSKVSDFSIDHILGPEVGRLAPSSLETSQGFTFSPERFFYGHTLNQDRLSPAPGSVLAPGCMPLHEMTFGNGRIFLHRPSSFHHVYWMVPYPAQPTHTGFHQLQGDSVAHLPAPQHPTDRQRTVFTVRQTQQLEELFSLTEYPGQQARVELAHSEGLSEETVRVWFKNRRARRKRQCNRSKVKFSSPHQLLSKQTNHKVDRSSCTENLLCCFL